MKRNLAFVFVWVLIFNLNASSHVKKLQPESGKVTIKCPPNVKLKKKGIRACPITGCGEMDRGLNQRKNVSPLLGGPVQKMTLDEMKALPDAELNFQVGEGLSAFMSIVAMLAGKSSMTSVRCPL